MRRILRKPQYNKNGIKMDTDRPPRKIQARKAEHEEAHYKKGEVNK